MANKINIHLKNHGKKYIISLLALSFGLSLGVLCVYALSEETKTPLCEYVYSYFSSYDIVSINTNANLKAAFFGQLKIYALLLFFSFFHAGAFICLACIAYQGFLLGFTGSVIIERFFYQGILLNAAAFIPQNLIKFTALIFACVCLFSLNESKHGTKSHNNYSKGLYPAFLLLLFISFIIYFIGVAVEVRIIPYLVAQVIKNMI